MLHKMSSFHSGRHSGLRQRRERTRPKEGDLDTGTAIPRGVQWLPEEIGPGFFKGWEDPPIVKTDYRERRKLDESPDKWGTQGTLGVGALSSEAHDSSDISPEALVVGFGFQRNLTGRKLQNLTPYKGGAGAAPIFLHPPPSVETPIA